MKNFLHLLFFLLFFSSPGWSQTRVDSPVSAALAQDTQRTQQKKAVAPPKKIKVSPPSIIKVSPPSIIMVSPPSIINIKDSVLPGKGAVVAPRIYNPHLLVPSYQPALKGHPYFNFFSKPVVRNAPERMATGKERLFYLLAGLLFFFAVIKVVFSKYFNNLLSLVFRASLKQKQIREQLLQTPLPSLLLNIFFVTVFGLYIVFILQYNRIAPDVNFWFLFFYCAAAVGIIYIVKFIMLKFTGWVFNMKEAADTYIFIIFLVNKLLGIFLLPLLILIAFAVSSWTEVLITLSYVLVIGFFAYRYIVAFAPVRREVKVSKFHFFVYLCAFEIIPLLLIYKVLLSFL